MELDKIEILIEKYFQGETSIAEENDLKKYFSSSDVAQHLEQYTPIFGYFSQAKSQLFTQEIPLLSKSRSKRNVAWFSIAASVVVLLSIGTFTYFKYANANANQDLGTYKSPELALQETQKALAMLSNQVNVGAESVQYIEEYNNAKSIIFKQ